MATTTLGSFNEMNWGSDSEDGDFNPVPAIDSDDEDAAVKQSPAVEEPPKSASAMTGDVYKSRKLQEDHSRDPQPSLTNGRNGEITSPSPEVRGTKRRRSPEPGDEEDDVTSDENEDDEEDEDEDEDEDGPVQRKHKKRKDRRNQFIDIEAEVDDDDEDIDEDEEGLEEVAGFIADNHPDDESSLRPGLERDDRHHIEFDRLREQQDNLTAEQLAEEMAERARQRNRTGHTDTTNLASRYLMPGADDPGMWMIKCRSGREKELVREINTRAHDYLLSLSEGSLEYYPIVSAFERDKIHPAHIYVECMSEQDMMKGFIGMVDVYPTVGAVKLSQKDMPAMLRVKPDKVLEEGAYVRIKGKSGYQRDLAQITAVFSNGVDIEVKLVPRPRPHEDVMKRQIKAQTGDAGVKARMGNPGNRKDGAKYPQVLLTRREAERLKLPITASDGVNRFQVRGDSYENGFLVKVFKINQLDYENIKPTLEEAVQFSSGGDQGTQRLDLKQLSDTLKESETSTPFVNGDEVEVFEGEQKGAQGRVVEALSETILKMRVTTGGLRGETLDVQVKNLRKIFVIGQHVKVISGAKFKDEMGMIVKISDNLVTFTSDSGGRELTVFSKDLTGARDTGTSAGLSSYAKHDLLQLDPTTVGCVIRVERELLRVLDQYGSVQDILPSRISNNLTAESRRAVAVDASGMSLKQNDMVRERGGERRTGRVIHLHRQQAYVLAPEDRNETDGLFVVRTNAIESLSITASGGVNGANGMDLGGMNPARGGVRDMPPPDMARGGRDKSVGKNVRVKKGGYKGLMGIVKDITGSEARIELHTKNKIVTVNIANLTFLDANGNATSFQPTSRDPPRSSMETSYGAGGGWQGGAGGRTPAVGAATPFAQGGRTPHWGATGANASALPSRTPAWGIGGGGGGGGGGGAGAGVGARTPAYGMGGQTAYGGGNMTTYGGGRTPAFGMAGSGHTAYGGGGGQTAYGGTGHQTAHAGAGVHNGYGAGAGGNTGYGGNVGGGTGYGGVVGGGTSYGGYGGRTPAAPNGGSNQQHQQQQQQHHQQGFAGSRTPATIPAPYGQSNENWGQESNGHPGSMTTRTPAWQSNAATIGGPTPKEPGGWGGASSVAATGGGDGWGPSTDGGPRYSSRSPSPA